jgi:hypothetical protein
VLEIPSSFTLDRLSNLRDARLQNVLPPPPNFPYLATQLPSDCFRTRTNITDALHAAINGGIHPSYHSINASKERKISEQLRDSFLSGCTPETSVSVALSMKVPIPRALHSAMVSYLPGPISLSEDITQPAQLSSQVALIHPGLPFWTPEPPVADTIVPFQHFYSPPPFTIGNLFLSSCPGKKGASILSSLTLPLIIS